MNQNIVSVLLVTGAAAAATFNTQVTEYPGSI